MNKNNIQTSGFCLAKKKELTGDDFYEVKVFDDIVVAVVCDGVGSADEGAQAAKRVTRHLINNFKTRPVAWSIEKSIKKFITSINAILYQESMQNYERCELVTTVAIVVIAGNRVYGANVGDSRVYLYREKALNQLSHDHNMDEKGYENVLTDAIGLQNTVEVFYFENNLEKDDKILLCSDGLYTLMSEDMLKRYLLNGAYALVKKASKLTEDNLPDDTTAVVIDIKETDEISVMKNLNLSIPQSLKLGDEIDGFKLTKFRLGILIGHCWRDDHVFTWNPVCRCSNTFTRHLQPIQRAQDFGKVTTNRHRISHRQLQLLVRADDEHRTHGRAMGRGAPVGHIGFSWQHIECFRHRQTIIRNNWETSSSTAITFDVSFPLFVVLNTVN